MKYQNRPSYNDYISSIKSLAKTGLPSITISYGPSLFLLARTEAWFKTKQNNSCVETLESSQCSVHDLERSLQQQSLFEPSSHRIIRVNEKTVTFAKKLKSLSKPSSTDNSILLSLEAKALPSSIQKEAKRLEAKVLACFPPTDKEIPKFINDLAQKKNLSLENCACQAIATQLGNDLVKISNELNRLSLIFADTKKPLKINEISPHLNYLRTDTIFKIEQMITSREAVSSFHILQDLLQRGESPLALLGVLTLFCRKVLQCQQLLKKGFDSRNVAQHLNIPHFATKNLVPYAIKSNSETIVQTLSLCLEADIIFKSQKHSDELILSEIVLKLIHA